MPNRLTLAPEVIAAAIDGLQEQKKRLDAQIAKLKASLPQQRARPEAHKSRRHWSAAARARMAKAQRLRWAKQRAASARSAAQ